MYDKKYVQIMIDNIFLSCVICDVKQIGLNLKWKRDGKSSDFALVKYTECSIVFPLLSSLTLLLIS